MKKLVLFAACILLAVSAFTQSDAQNEKENEKKITLIKIGKYSCGKQPKQVLFSPDGEYILLPLLDDKGVDVFSVKEKKIVKRITPPKANQVGFAEGLFIPEKGVFLVSQMTTATVYEYSYPGFELKRSIPTEGNWSKFIAWSPEKNMLAVSNWVSNDVSLIDYDSGKVLTKLKTGKAPRGLYFYNGGNNILTLSYESGLLESFNTETYKRVNSIKITNASMRHVSVESDTNTAYISDMYFTKVYKLDLGAFKITDSFATYHKPNTIELYNDDILFISCRGPNNPVDYTRRSPKDGKVQVIDTNTMTLLTEIQGGNQPTGLAISPDRKLLCFSNFQDANIELYSIECE
ncbi:MAG: YVTN family beta-propeller repeat-containing protein [Treponema sp.]|nr:YVTN family beta-propeller repeat-containing protein [Treponema sp.]